MDEKAEGKVDNKGGRRRRFFKRLGIATLIGGLAAGLGARAWAGGGHWRHGGGMGPEHVERMVKHFAVEVDATPEQRARLTEIAQSAAAELAPMREKARAARKQAMDLLAAPTVDRAAMEQLRAEQLVAMEAASRRLTKALADAAEVLTPEQRKQLAGRFRDHPRWSHG
jgi:Spy/CpxP family protein refolding chaperone